MHSSPNTRCATCNDIKFFHGVSGKCHHVDAFNNKCKCKMFTVKQLFIAGTYQVAIYQGDGTSSDIFDITEFRRRYGDKAESMLQEIYDKGAAAL